MQNFRMHLWHVGARIEAMKRQAHLVGGAVEVGELFAHGRKRFAIHRFSVEHVQDDAG